MLTTTSEHPVANRTGGPTQRSETVPAMWLEDFQIEAVPADTKWAFVTRNVPTDQVVQIRPMTERVPQPGDLVLAEVRKIAQHTRIQLRDGRRSRLYPGDKVIVAYGNRYAPDQFEAVVPGDLDECHLVAAGGVAARAVSKHASLKWPTSLRPEGFCLNARGDTVNLSQYAICASHRVSGQHKPVIAVLGTSMNSGKTTTVASLVKGLGRSGCRVAALKATGTGSGNDLWAYEDAGATLALDFTDAGHPSTFKVARTEIERCLGHLLTSAHADQRIDIIVVEIADGLLHNETSELVVSNTFKRHVDHVLFAAGEAMGALAGVQTLHRLDVTPLALSGVVSASTLAATEAHRATGLPVLTKRDLESGNIAGVLGL